MNQELEELVIWLLLSKLTFAMADGGMQEWCDLVCQTSTIIRSVFENLEISCGIWAFCKIGNCIGWGWPMVTSKPMCFSVSPYRGRAIWRMYPTLSPIREGVAWQSNILILKTLGT